MVACICNVLEGQRHTQTYRNGKEGTRFGKEGHSQAYTYKSLIKSWYVCCWFHLATVDVVNVVGFT